MKQNTENKSVKIDDIGTAISEFDRAGKRIKDLILDWLRSDLLNEDDNYHGFDYAMECYLERCGNARIEGVYIDEESGYVMLEVEDSSGPVTLSWGTPEECIYIFNRYESSKKLKELRRRRNEETGK